jgi:hypothetical protein
MTVTLLRPVIVAAKEGPVVFVTLFAGATVECEYVPGEMTDVVCHGETYLAMCQDLLDASRPEVPVES